MKIAVIGTGGVGGYFGGRLAKAGFDVTFVARGAHLEKIKTDGLVVKSVLGDFQVNNIHATNNISDIKNPGLIIIATKADQVKEIRKEIKKVLIQETVILPLQNGISAAEELSEEIDSSYILGGLCRIISKIESPGVINHFAISPVIVFGELNKKISARVTAIKKIFEYAGIDSKISEDIEADIWKKFIGICVSGLLAITRTTYGELRSIAQTRTLMINLLTEIYRLSRKIGVSIEDDFVEKTVSVIDSFPFDSTTSLSRDVWEGRPSEIHYQNGAVVKLGKKYGIKTPVNSFAYNCILPSELKARGMNFDLKICK